jgi:ESS family glutamate:Na+ symporter
MTTLIELSIHDTVVAAILVLFLGKYLTSKVAFLQDYNIPEPVSGGLIASILFGVAYAGRDRNR